MTLRPAPADRTPTERLEFGVINLDKPPGPSAHQVSGWIRDAVIRTLNDVHRREQREVETDAPESSSVQARSDLVASIDRAAHAGTLDPKVTGCLPIMLGTATRLAPVFLEGSKEYVAVLECHAPVPTDVESTIATFEGEIYQKPPRKSAVARRHRIREIYTLDVLETADRQVLVRIECESGTYIRKLCHDIGLALGTGGHMGDLRRIRTDPFDDTSLHTPTDVLDALAFWSEDDDPDPLLEIVEPGERILDDLPSVTIAPSAATEVANGAPVYAPGVIDADEAAAGSRVACFTPNGSAVCLGTLVRSPDANEGIVVDLERVLV